MKLDKMLSSEINDYPRDHVNLSNRTLVIGNLKRWKLEGKLTSELDDFNFIDFDVLTSETLLNLMPDIVFSPLLGDDFDALDIAARLLDLGFTGRYRVVTFSVPDVEIIRADICHHAPGLDFDLLIVPNENQIG